MIVINIESIVNNEQNYSKIVVEWIKPCIEKIFYNVSIVYKHFLNKYWSLWWASYSYVWESKHLTEAHRLVPWEMDKAKYIRNTLAFCSK